MNAQKQPLPEIPRVNVLGVGVSAIDMESALSVIRHALEHGRRGYVCVTGVHGVMEAQADPDFRRIQNSSLLTTPDGMPLVWAGRLRAFRIGRVYGPDLMLKICGISPGLGYRHFFFGGKPGVAEKLQHAMQARFPGLAVVGTYSPPFRRLTTAEEAELFRMVEAGKPHFFWVGLSTPKQERFMAEYSNRLPVKIMVGVGAAFDIHTGGIKDSPAWVKNAGLQWLHRLLQEPKRLWRRYLINNPRFLYQIMLQFLALKQFPMLGLAESGNGLGHGMYLAEMAKGHD